ncbi:MAG: hypothetical protein LQ344_006412 [Seirophora lacunosa]|nr:MAG: hypothetical protein LQ344_006412 [Seirophora lacunosa]
MTRVSACDCSEVIRILHNLDRASRKGNDYESKKLIHTLVESVRQAYVSGSLPWTRHATLHLLGYYKESGHLDEGLDFWKWLSRAEGVILDPVYVGAAIELLAVCGAGIHYCEEVYERTLAEQRDIGSQYYLTPGAILPDRAKAVTTRGTSSGLLQGIISARLLHGKWQRAYLTLDTVFALRPTQIAPRFLDVFVFERPIFEALSVFFMYCRGGNAVSKATLTTILKTLSDLANRATHYSTQLQLVGAMFRVAEAYTGSAGRLGLIHLNVLTRAFVNAIPRMPVATPAGSTDRQARLQNTVAEAALLQDSELLKSVWACVRTTSTAEPDYIPDTRTWQSLAAAAASCGLESFVEEQLQSLPPESLWRTQSALTSVEKYTPEQLLPLKPMSEGLDTDNIEVFRDMCNTVCSSLEDAGVLQNSGFRNFYEHPIDEPTMFEWPKMDKETWQRKLYDDLTMDQSSKDLRLTSAEGLNGVSCGAPDTMPDVSNTGIPFDELRYANWKTINKLLAQAEAWERNADVLSGTATSDSRERKTLPRKRDSINATGATAVHYPVSARQLEAYQQDIENERARSMSEEEWRNRIIKLRNGDYEV